MSAGPPPNPAPASPVPLSVSPRFSIAFAEDADLPACAALLDEMHHHYRGLEGHEQDLPPRDLIEQEARRWIAEAEGIRLLLARDASTRAPAALACLAVLRPGRALKGLVFVKDLYVAEAARRRGAGRAVLTWLFDWARAEGLGRVDLATDIANAPARALYASLGGDERPEAGFVRFDLS